MLIKRTATWLFAWGALLWASMALEYGSGTPAGHGDGDHEQEAGESDHSHGGSEETALRVPQHFTQNLTLGWDLLSRGEQPRLGLQFNIENLTDNVYKVAQESVFSPGQFYIPRLFSGSVKIRF